MQPLQLLVEFHDELWYVVLDILADLPLQSVPPLLQLLNRAVLRKLVWSTPHLALRQAAGEQLLNAHNYTLIYITAETNTKNALMHPNYCDCCFVYLRNLFVFAIHGCAQVNLAVLGYRVARQRILGCEEVSANTEIH